MAGKTLAEYLKKIETVPDEDVYKVYEEYAKDAFAVDLTDMKNYNYWTVLGEAEAYYGSVVVFENKETLLGKAHGRERPKELNGLLQNVYVKDVLKLMPDKCKKCGFHRFFGLKIDVTSLGQYISVFCPNCKKQFGNVDADSGEIEKYD
ncbi:MAG: hypothetical protein NTV88_00965 [Candidatus Micrarchaeota archaeon]|nr:hypothetical protein [Candidatus Micrarchaeota archaeon]